YSTYYDVKYPGHERNAGRPLRVSPVYSRLADLGAAFGEKSGWERVNWFEPNGTRGDQSLRPHGWAGQLWSPAIGVEHRACREAAAIFDFTSFAKIEVRGSRAAEFLESLADNRVARDVGALTYTQMLNEGGGIECDFTVTRLGERRFRVITLARSPGHVRRRAGLGAVLSERVRASVVGHDLGGGARSGPGRRWLQSRRLAAPGEGLPRLGRGHHVGDRPLPGGSWFLRQAGQGRVHRPLGAADETRSTGRHQARLPRAGGSTIRRPWFRARADRRQHRGSRHERRLRLHDRPLDRLRVHPGDLP